MSTSSRPVEGLRSFSSPATPSTGKTRRRGRRAATVMMLSACAGAALSRSASAATVVWDGGHAGTGAAWLADVNWNPDLGTGTGPAISDTAQFDAAGSAAAITIDMGATTN